MVEPPNRYLSRRPLNAHTGQVKPYKAEITFPYVLVWIFTAGESAARKSKPLNLSKSSLSAIMPVYWSLSIYAYQPSWQSAIMAISHHACLSPLAIISLSAIMAISHSVSQKSCPSAIILISHHANQPSDFETGLQ